MNEIQKMFFKNFDSIYKSCKKVSRKFGMKHCSLVYLKKVIDIAKSNTVDKSEKEAFAIQMQYFNVLDALYKTCASQAKDIGAAGVSFDFLKQCITVIKSNFKLGIDAKQAI